MKKFWFILVAGICLLIFHHWSSAWADIPRMINYQGKLTSALGGPVNAETGITFSIYTESSGGGAIWSEVQTVTVTDGVFNVLLGSINPLATDYFTASGSIYLGVKVESDAEMTPRMEIASTAYSMRSAVAEVAEDISQNVMTSLLEAVYPVGAIYTSTVDTNPATLFGFGTWTAFGAGRVPVGYNAGDSDFNSVEKTGGEKAHTLTTSEIPAHRHDVRQRANSPTPYSTFYNTNYTGGSACYVHTAVTKMVATSSTDDLFTTDTGGGGSHNNLPPYIVVYMWKRTS